MSKIINYKNNQNGIEINNAYMRISNTNIINGQNNKIKYDVEIYKDEEARKSSKEPVFNIDNLIFDCGTLKETAENNHPIKMVYLGLTYPIGHLFHQITIISDC